MIRSASTIAAVTNKASQAKAAESSLQGAENLSEQNAGMESGFASGFPSFKKGFDLAQVPAKTGLQTGLSVQCCAKDGTGCSCPTCKAKDDGEERFANVESLHNSPARTESAAAAAGAETATSESETETEGGSTETSTSEAGGAGASGGLIVDDASADIGEGQMTKTAFLEQLRTEICGTIGPVLATVGQTTEGCPYLNYWLNLYQDKTAAEVEATVKRYAPDSVTATSATQYVSVVTGRALRAAVIWATTGRLSGVPEGVPTTLPGESGAGESGGSSGSQAFTIRAKAKPGGSRNMDDPAAVQKELGDGSPLASDVRSRMENAFGMNFSHVRTHTDSGAAQISNRANARAFTVGNHVAFGSGEYHPGTMIGDALIAHELAHVVQQKDASASVDKMENGSAGYEALEQDADHAATGVLSRLWGGKSGNMQSNAQGFMPSLRSGLRMQHCSSNRVPTKSISVQPVRIAEDNGTAPTAVPSFGEAQTIWRNCCINISVNAATTISESDYKTLDDPGVGSTPSAEETAMFAAAGLSGTAIPVFIPHTFTDGTTTGDDISGGGVSYFSGTPNPRLVVVEAIHPRIIAHELGHAMGYTFHTTGTVMEGTGRHNVAPPNAVNSSICSTVRGYSNHTTSGSDDCSLNP